MSEEVNSYTIVMDAIASAAEDAAGDYVQSMATSFHGAERALERMSTLHLLANDPATILVIAQAFEEGHPVTGLTLACDPGAFGSAREDPDVKQPWPDPWNWYRWAAGQTCIILAAFALFSFVMWAVGHPVTFR